MYSDDVALLLPSVRTAEGLADLTSRVDVVFLKLVPVDLLVSAVPLFMPLEAVVLRVPAIAEASRMSALRATPDPVVVRLPYL